MKSQIPTRAAAYFEQNHVDLGENHPAVTAWFRPGKGWRPTLHPVPVSHAYLVRIRDQHGVTGVQLTAGGRAPDYGIDELVGKMGLIDAEMVDGVPLSEGSGVVGTLQTMIDVLSSIGVSTEDTRHYLIQAAVTGESVFVVREIDSFTQTTIEGWRYRLAPHGKVDGQPGYELRVLAHDERKEA